MKWHTDNFIGAVHKPITSPRRANLSQWATGSQPRAKCRLGSIRERPVYLFVFRHTAGLNREIDGATVAMNQIAFLAVCFASALDDCSVAARGPTNCETERGPDGDR